MPWGDCLSPGKQPWMREVEDNVDVAIRAALNIGVTDADLRHGCLGRHGRYRTTNHLGIDPRPTTTNTMSAASGRRSADQPGPEHEKMKTNNHFKFDLVVTRHAPLVEWLLREGYINESTPVVDHAHADRVDWMCRPATNHRATSPGMWEITAGQQIIGVRIDMAVAMRDVRQHNLANVRGKHVLGVLPHHLSCMAASITEVQLAWTVEDRAAMQSGDLDVEAVARAARGLHTYVVQRYDGAN